MNEHKYTISKNNAHQTIHKLYELLSSRHIKVKKSDLKEAISLLLGYKNSNILDEKIKKHNDKLEALSIFEKGGKHKHNKNLILQSQKNPLKTSDFFNKNKSLNTIISFCDSFKLSQGYHYKNDDILFSNDRVTALKTLLDWDNHVKISIKYHADDKYSDEKEGCYWELHFIGDGDEQYLGDEGYLNTYHDEEVINKPDVELDLLENTFIEKLLEYDTPFFVHDRKEFSSYLWDCFIEYYAETYSAKNENEFIEHIEKFIPYIGIQKIVELEISESSLEYIKLLKKYGAKFDKSNLLISAARAGRIDVCEYLIESGNSIKYFLKKGFAGTYFHEEVHQNLYDDEIEPIKKFYATAKYLGISVNTQDNDGNAPIHYSAKHGSEELYNYLLELGADENLKNKQGNTPVKILQAMKEIIQKNGEDAFSIFFGSFSDAEEYLNSDEDN